MLTKYLLLARCVLNEDIKKAIFDIYYDNIDEGLHIANKLSSYFPKEEQIANEISISLKNNCNFITIKDNDYPERLKTISTSPIVLSIKGNKNILSKNIVAISGTREPEEEDFSFIRAITDCITQSGFYIASGLAIGSDSISQMQSVKSGTIAIMAHGLKMCYPKENKILFDKILYYGGAIISEYGFATKPTQVAFIKRNRIMVGMSISTIIMRAKKRHCGTITTAEYAKKYSRPIYTINPSGVCEGNLYLLKTKLARQIMSLEELRYNLFMDCINKHLDNIADRNNKKNKQSLFSTIGNTNQNDVDIPHIKQEVNKIILMSKIKKLTQYNFTYATNLCVEQLHTDKKLIQQSLLELLCDVG